MDDGSQGNAMTEVALAHAMGFFSLLMLAMISMGVGMFASSSKLTLVLAPSTTQDSKEGATSLDPDTLVIIYHQGRFLDDRLKPLKPDSIDTTRSVVLAFAPNIPMAEAMDARTKIAATDLLVSTLDEDWRAALARLDAASGSAR